MNLLDVNVLLGLFFDDHPLHERSARWFTGAELAGGQMAVPHLVWVGFLRLATNPRAFTHPATFAEAWAFARLLRSREGYLDVVFDGSVLAELERVAQEASARADLVTDAYIAACAITVAATVVTFDRDFRRFDGLRIVEPA